MYNFVVIIRLLGDSRATKEKPVNKVSSKNITHTPFFNCHIGIWKRRRNYFKLLKTGSFDNAIREFSLA